MRLISTSMPNIGSGWTRTSNDGLQSRLSRIERMLVHSMATQMVGIEDLLQVVCGQETGGLFPKPAKDCDCEMVRN